MPRHRSGSGKLITAHAHGNLEAVSLLFGPSVPVSEPCLRASVRLRLVFMLREAWTKILRTRTCLGWHRDPAVATRLLK